MACIASVRGTKAGCVFFTRVLWSDQSIIREALVCGFSHMAHTGALHCTVFTEVRCGCIRPAIRRRIRMHPIIIRTVD